MYEGNFTAILCSLLLGGETEVRHPYNVGYDLHFIRVDCENDSHVLEVGLDKRSSLDSVQQALFAASRTGKAPMVVMIDTDGREDQYEYRVRTAAKMAGVEYRVYDKDFLIRWQMTDYLRNAARTGM
ncbi:hypothetical protein [Aliiroseovarius subalbicans]|uniref:hypothetical protein n=1 Tax=Aliiroseovarius subalbicans TaxID=2925840 RepID=UPI001F5A52B4|nr:hypothetical protein [Aliiroseovarius subalbicans]MCI2397852.1 hypothetical protein [Aliiroseovarius subalbicans]